jgi:hypothetical protein
LQKLRDGRESAGAGEFFPAGAKQVFWNSVYFSGRECCPPAWGGGYEMLLHVFVGLTNRV